MKLKTKQSYLSADLSELRKKIVELKLHIFNLTSEKNIKTQKNTRAVKNIRKEIAVILSYIREKELKHE